VEVIISMLRGINVGGHHKIGMSALREVYESLGLRDVKTFIQSGNAVFRSDARDLVILRNRIEDEIERTFGFRPDVILRSIGELREAIVNNPFAARDDIHPSKLLVTFLAEHPTDEACEKVLAMEVKPEELRMAGREMFIYFPNGMGRTKLPLVKIEKALKTSGTGRNWNTVRKLLEMAENL
jgi:uncharacterized protein (DUF1697 family)